MHVTDRQKPNVIFSSNIRFQIATCVAENHLFLGGNTSRLVDLAPSIGELEVVLHLNAILLRNFRISPFDLVRRNLVYVAKSKKDPDAAKNASGFSGVWKNVFELKNSCGVFVVCLRLTLQQLIVDLADPENITLSFVNNEMYSFLQDCDPRIEASIAAYIRTWLLTELQSNTDLSKDITNSHTILQELPLNEADALVKLMPSSLEFGSPIDTTVDADVSLISKHIYDDEDFDPSGDEIRVLHSDDDIKALSDDSAKMNEDEEELRTGTFDVLESAKVNEATLSDPVDLTRSTINMDSSNMNGRLSMKDDKLADSPFLVRDAYSIGKALSQNISGGTNNVKDGLENETNGDARSTIIGNSSYFGNTARFENSVHQTGRRLELTGSTDNNAGIGSFNARSANSDVTSPTTFQGEKLNRHHFHAPLTVHGLSRVPEDDEDFVGDLYNLRHNGPFNTDTHDISGTISDLSFDVEEIHIDNYSPEPECDAGLSLCTPSKSAPMILNESSPLQSAAESLPPSPVKGRTVFSPRVSRQQSTPEMQVRKKSSFALIATDDNYGLDYAFRNNSDSVPSFIKQDKKFKFIKVGKVQKFVHLFEEKMDKEPGSATTSRDSTRPGSPLRRTA